MPTAELTWNEWHITDHDAVDDCAEDLYNNTPSYRSVVQRMRDNSGEEIRSFQLIRPDDTAVVVPLGSWVVLLGGMLQVMTNDQHADLVNS